MTDIVDVGFVADNDIYLFAAALKGDRFRARCKSRDCEYDEETGRYTICVPRTYDALESIFFPLSVRELTIRIGQMGAVVKRFDDVHQIRRVDFDKLPLSSRYDIRITYKLSPEPFQGEEIRFDTNWSCLGHPLFTMTFDRNHPIGPERRQMEEMIQNSTAFSQSQFM